MDLRSFLKSLPVVERQTLAHALGKSLWRLNNLAYGRSKPSPKLAVAIERTTNGAVSRKDIYPDDWAEIWPELVPSGKPNIIPVSRKIKSQQSES